MDNGLQTTKLSELPEAITLNESDYSLIVQNGTSKKIKGLLLKGNAGDNGKSIEIQKTDTHIQWRQEGGQWINLVALADLKGDKGEQGEGANVDLTDYATKVWVTQQLASYYTKAEIDLSLSNKANISHAHTEYASIDHAHNYNDLTNKPTIPSKTSDLTNDSGFLTSIPSEYVTEEEMSTALSTKANKSDIPSLEGYATETFVTNKIAEASLSGSEVDLSGYATKDDLTGYATKTYVDNAIDTALDGHTFKFLTQAEYDALKTKDPLVEYHITDITDTGEGLTTEQAQQLQIAYEHSQTVHVQASDIPSLDGYATETYVDNSINVSITEEKNQINNAINSINEQLDTKASKNEIFTMDNMGQDIKEAIAEVGKNSILEENIADGQVTRNKLSNVICGRDFEVNNTKAYPGISFTVNNAPKGKNITIKCKITTKNTPRGIRFTYNYGSAYQSNNFVYEPLINVEKVYEYTWENASDRVITSFTICVNSNDQSTNFNALIKEVRLYIDGKEHFDFDMQNDIGVTDLTDYSYTLASRKFIEDTIGSLNTDVTITKLDSSIFGKKYEVSGFTYAYPRVYLVKFKQYYPSGNIKFSFKVTPKNRMDYFKITTDAWQSPEYQIRVIYPNETTLIEGSIAPTREFTMLGICLGNSSPTACLDGIYEDFIVKIDDNIVDFEMATASINEEEKTIVDVSEEQYLVASKPYVKEYTDKSIEALQDNFKHGDKTIHYNALNEDIVGNCFYVHKVSVYPGMKFNLSLKINQGQRVQLVYKAKIIEGNTGHHCTFQYGGSYNGLQCNATEIGKVQEVKSNVMEFSADKTITMVSIAKNSNNPNTTCHQYVYDPCIVVDGVRYPLTEDMLVEDSDALTLQSIKEEFPILATKKFVEDSINSAINGVEKREFVLPFVNNLYVVQGSKRKQSVPIFIDYLYNGNKDKILFENGEDRAYIREARLSPESQPASILNTKETLKFKSETLDVSDVTFNKISIEEKTPNGKIRLLTIGDSVTAGAITEKQYWAVARELFALEDIDMKRNSDVMFLGSNNVRNTTINYNGVEKQVKSCACGISSWALSHWLTNSSSHFVYDDNETPVFSILKWIERYRTHLDDGTKLELGDSRLGTEITSSNIDNIQCCTPNIVYINSTHNGGSIEQHEQMIEIIQREIPGCKIIVGSPMPLTGTWHREKYVGKDWLDDEGCITGPNYSWGGGYGSSRIESLNYYTQRERENKDNTFYFMPQVVTMPTVEALEYDLVDCGVKMMKQPTKVNQLPKEHPGTLAHKIWGYELYALLKYISGVEQGVTNNFDTVPLFEISE